MAKARHDLTPVAEVNKVLLSCRLRPPDAAAQGGRDGGALGGCRDLLFPVGKRCVLQTATK